MTSEAVTRGMEMGDLVQVASIDRRSFHRPWKLSRYLAELRKSTAACHVLATPAGEITGFAVASLAAGELEIVSLAVDPARRFNGHGEALLGAVLESGRGSGAEVVFLEVRSSNGSALRLYERSGFQSVGRRKGYYLHGNEDAVVMRLSLPSAG